MIKGLKQDGISQFTGKAVTRNLTESNPGSLLSAKNVLILSDGQLRRAPGYTLVTQVGAGRIKAFYDFQRNVDQHQIVFVESGGEIYYMNADGSGLTLISSGETGTHQWVSTSFAAYSSDGHNAWRYVDKGGVLTKYKWGITAPTTAPAISLSAGTLTLTYGRTYVYCFVSKYTDSLGIQRISVSAPSPVSAHTGPIASQVVLLSGLQVSSDPQVNYKWIFAVSDSPVDTSATYYFAAEITNATTSWGDTLIDDALDDTRLAPFDNHPAPPAPMLAEFQNRIVAAKGNLMQLSGYAEITLGIPEEAWPSSLFFNVPSGKRTISGLGTMQQGTVLIVSTQDYFYAYTGYDAITFTEQDRVGSPGFAGPLARVLTPEGLMYLGANQSVRVWRGPGGPEPTSISDDNAKKLAGTYAMEDIDPAHIAESQLLWYDFGPMNLLVVFARTSDENPNVLVNGDFLDGSTGWIFETGWTRAFGPVWLAMYTGPGTAAVVNTTHVVCAPGQVVRASCNALGEVAATGTAQLRITFYDAGGTQIGPNYNSAPCPNNYIWTPLSLAQAAPAGATQAIVDYAVYTSTNGARWFVTDVYATAKDDGFNLMQLWSFVTQAQDSSGTYGSGSGVYTQLTGTYLTDKLPSQIITAAGSVNVGFAGQDFIFLGDAHGNVYRWPDGFTDNGNPYYGTAQHAWHLPNEGKSRYYWADLVTDRSDSALSFQVYAATADAPDQGITPTQLNIQQMPSPVRQSGYAIRASMNAPGTATGKYCTLWISFPTNDADAVVRKLTLASRPINAGLS